MRIHFSWGASLFGYFWMGTETGSTMFKREPLKLGLGNVGLMLRVCTHFSWGPQVFFVFARDSKTRSAMLLKRTSGTWFGECWADA